jgi:hypothetical protein
LASKIGGLEEPIKPDPKAEARPSTPRKSSQPQPEATSSEPERKAPAYPSSVETVNSNKSGGGSGGKWFLGILGVFIVIGIIHSGGKSNKNISYNPPAMSQRYSHEQGTPALATKDSSVAQNHVAQYIKPSIGTNNVLSMPEIRWCIREGIRIETMRNVVNTNNGIKKFNKKVNDYNTRCGSYRYRKGSLSRAKRDVEPYRSEIVHDAISNAKKYDQQHLTSSSISPNLSKRWTAKNPSTQYTKEAQQLLKDLNYNPGPIDGKYGRQTADAVRAFQNDAGLTQDGRIDQNLLISLWRAKIAYKPQATSKTNP